MLAVHVRDAVEVGDRIDVAAPRGRFTLDDDGERPVALVSAGVGVTPVLAMLHALSAGQATREVWWLHGARKGAEHVFAYEARSLLASLPQARSRVWYRRPDPSDRVGLDHDEVGHITADALAATRVPADSEYYNCGPPAFMDALCAGLDALGVSPARVHTEAFGAESSIAPASSRRPHDRRTDRTLGRARAPHLVRPPGLNARRVDAFTSILELAEACDVPVRWSCRTDVCHTCETGLLDGTVAYDPEPLEPPGAGNVLVCCSRPGSNLAVDL